MATQDDTLPLLEGPDRVHYATGVMLGAEDFQAEQDYHRGRLARALAYALGYGTLAGLRVEHQPARPEDAAGPAHAERLVVAPGLAIDRLGRLMELDRPWCLALEDWYAAQPAAALGAAWHPADALWAGAPAGVAADLFARFVVCPRGRTPAFASDAFDSFDSVTAARLRDGMALSLVLRPEASPPLPQPQWPDFGGDPAALREAVLDAWREPAAHPGGALPSLPEQLPGQDPAALFLARLLLPADPPAGGQAPARRAGEPVAVRNDLRPFVIPLGALVRWLGIGAT